MTFFSHLDLTGYRLSDLGSIPLDAVEGCSDQGQVDDAVEFWTQKLEFNADPEKTKSYLKSTGAWDDQELSDHDQNLRRLFWLICCDLNETGEREAFERGVERGKTVATWCDFPELGAPIPKSIDWIGLGDFVTEENLLDVTFLICRENEEQDRCYSPFEFTAKEFNESPYSETLWAAFDEGIIKGIKLELKKRLDRLKG